MSQPQRTKHPLAVLQSMINGILIETGKALRAADKEGGRTVANANTRLRSTIPSAVDNFHQALDELESDITQAKAALVRDLAELTADRIAEENPPIEAVDDIPKLEPNMLDELLPESDNTMESKLPSSPIATKEEHVDFENPAQQLQTDDTPQLPLTIDTPKETVTMPVETEKGGQSPEPAAIEVIAQASSGVLGTDASATISDLVPADFQDSSIDALFGISDSNNDNATSDLTFNIDFPLLEPNETQDLSQNQSNDFSHSTFRDVSQDFMIDMQPINDANSGNDDLNTISNTQLNVTDNSFSVGDVGAVEDAMDLDLDQGTVGAEDSAFDSMFFDGADDIGMGGGGDMVHGVFDNAFFGITD